MHEKPEKLSRFSIIMILVVTSLGYLVDAADIALASIVRVEAIKSLGLATTPEEIKRIGILFENWQAWGILAGCFIWGMLADKMGRIKILYFTIAIYSVATLLNGFITTSWNNITEWYCFFRFMSGFGLAAEFGIAITIVTEVFPKEKRGLGTMIVAGFGILGIAGVAAISLYSSHPWHLLFRAGGIAGLILLVIRIGVHESPIFKSMLKSKKVHRGEFFTLFTDYSRFKRLSIAVLIGIPTFFVVGLPIRFALNFGEAFNIPDVSIPMAIMICQISLTISDFICNWLSQVFKSRRIMFLIYNSFTLFAILLFTQYPPKNAFQYHFIYTPILGASIGYWALIATTAAETFGTNLRATVTTMVANLLRASFIPIAFLFSLLEHKVGTVNSATIIGVTCCVIALIASYNLKETFSRNLKFVEK